MKQYNTLTDLMYEGENPDREKIQARFKETIDNYVHHRYPPGHFITAILENDLVGAFEAWH